MIGQEPRLRSAIDTSGVVIVVTLLDIFLRYNDSVLGFVFASTSLLVGVDILEISQWLVFVTAVTVFAPDVSPAVLRNLISKPLFRLLYAIGSTTIGVSFYYFHLPRMIWSILLVSVVVYVLTLVLMGYYDVEIFTEDSPVVEAMDTLLTWQTTATEELRDIRNYEGMIRRVEVVSFVIMAIAPFYLLTLTTGAIIFILAKIFPIPDLFILVYSFGMISGLHKSLPRLSSKTLVFDEYLYRFARNSTESIHGLFVVASTLLGFFTSVFMPLSILFTFGVFLSSHRSFSLVSLWNSLGVVLLLIFGIGFNVWFWIRMIPRLTAYLESQYKSKYESSFRSRPRTLTLFPSLLIVLANTVVENYYSLEDYNVLFAFVWPVAILAVSWLFWRVTRRHPTLVHREDIHATLAVFISLNAIPAQRAIFNGDVSYYLSPSTFIVWIFLIFLVVNPRIIHISMDNDDYRRFSWGVFAFCFGLCLIISSVLATLPNIVRILGGLLIASSFYFVFAKYHDL